MPFSRGGIQAWGIALLVAALTLGARPVSLLAQPPAALSKSGTAGSSRESGSPDAPPPPTPVSTPAGGKSGGQTSGQPPDVEAPALGAPSGFDAATPEAGPARGGEAGRPVPEEEAPALGGPSGGEQPPEEAAAGRYAPWWTRVPNVQPFPPPGNTIVPPRGRGYYTFWELLTGDRREGPPRYPYPRFGIIQFPFYNADWRYLDNRDNEQDRDFFDIFKRIRIADDFMFTAGGEYRWRYNNEVDSRLSGVDNTYYSTRTRVYGDLWYRDRFRIFGELITAQVFDLDLPPLATDQYNPNFLNLFADARL